MRTAQSHPQSTNSFSLDLLEPVMSSPVITVCLVAFSIISLENSPMVFVFSWTNSLNLVPQVKTKDISSLFVLISLKNLITKLYSDRSSPQPEQMLSSLTPQKFTISFLICLLCDHHYSFYSLFILMKYKYVRNFTLVYSQLNFFPHEKYIYKEHQLHTIQ